MRERAIGIVLLLAVSVACNRAGTSTMSDAFSDRAIELVENLEAGRFEAVVDDFDPTMRSQLPADVLDTNWRTYQEIVGEYEDHGEPERVMRGELVVERVPITTSRGEGEVRVTYRPDGTVAGLYFLRADAPPP